MRGQCAKQKVTCVITCKDGYAEGENDCYTPQLKCPREIQRCRSGEGYVHCRNVCGQEAHAEINALNKAKAMGLDTKDSFVYIFGHNYSCEPCKTALRDAGCASIYFPKPRFGSMIEHLNG